MCMEPIATMTLPKCYNATVKETETITEAQPICLVRAGRDANEARAPGWGVPAAPHIERS